MNASNYAGRRPLLTGDTSTIFFAMGENKILIQNDNFFIVTGMINLNDQRDVIFFIVCCLNRTKNTLQRGYAIHRQNCYVELWGSTRLGDWVVDGSKCWQWFFWV